MMLLAALGTVLQRRFEVAPFDDEYTGRLPLSFGRYDRRAKCISQISSNVGSSGTAGALGEVAT